MHNPSVQYVLLRLSWRNNTAAAMMRRLLLKKGQWQVSMVMGSSQMFNNNTENYLLPTYWNGQNFSFRMWDWAIIRPETNPPIRLLTFNWEI